MGDIAFDESSFAAVAESTSQETRKCRYAFFLFSYGHAWVVMCQWLQVFGNDIFLLVCCGLGSGDFFLEKLGPVQWLRVVKPK